MKKFIQITAIAVFLLVSTYRASAMCPDRINCYRHDGVMGYVINYVPTCYKFLRGCRPWHCEKSDFKNTDQHYWEHRCAEYLGGICEDSYGRILCNVSYPLY